MTDDVIKELRSVEVSPFHQALLDHVKNLIKLSRSDMSKYYSDWDKQDQVYRGIRMPDRDDKEQASRGKPIKCVVPNTFAQVQTFTASLFLMFKQNRTFFELVGTGDEDSGTKLRDIEAVLDQNLRYSQFDGVLYQKLTDTARFGLGVTECAWTRDVIRANVPGTPVMTTFEGVSVETNPGSSWQDFTKYEGNLVRSVSPYRFFPDTRFPIGEFQRGEFCGAEEEYSIAQLRQLESVGEVAGVDHIPPLPRNWEKARGGATRTTMDLATPNGKSFLMGPGPSKSEGTVLVTKVQVRLVPAKFKFGPKDLPLGPEDFPVLYHVWYANDSRVIRAEPAGWWHNLFGWTVSQYTPDMHQTINLGLADMIYRLQDVITWLYNSRITDVRRNVRGRNLINPALVDMKSVDGEGDIYLRSGQNGALLDRAMRPLDVRDVTAGHISDAENLARVMEVVTGVNGNAMGQYGSGRRAAREVSVVTAGSMGRVKMHGHLIFSEGLAPLGLMMTSNVRQSLSQSMFNRIIGDAATLDPSRFLAFQGTPEEVICNTDYYTFDSTMASERGITASSLQELMMQVIANPAAAQFLDIDPRALLSEIQWLRGAGNVSRFSLARNVAAGASPLPLPQPEPEVSTNA